MPQLTEQQLTLISSAKLLRGNVRYSGWICCNFFGIIIYILSHALLLNNNNIIMIDDTSIIVVVDLNITI